MTHLRIVDSPATYASTAVGLSMESFVEEGLLWAINASVFHPRGLVLATSTDPDVPFVLMSTNGREAISFAQSEAPLCDHRFRRFERLVRRLRVRAREKE